MSAYGATPALVIGLALLLAIVPIALIGGIVRRIIGRPRTTDRDDRPVTLETEDRTSRTGFARPRPAFLEHAQRDGTPEQIPLKASLMRIGSADDNDIVLTTPGLARYHAAIERTREMDHYIVDLTGRPQPGVTVNGEPTTRRRLRDGDMLTISSAQLTFRKLAS